MTLPEAHPFLLTMLTKGDAAECAWQSVHDTEWDRVVEDAVRHGLAPWLYRWSCAHSGIIPERSRARLKADTAAWASRTLLFADELAAILRALDRRCIPCAPLRGLALAEYLPGAPCVRPTGDLDLLIRRNDCAGVREVLRDLGYTEVDRQPGFAQTYSYTLEFVKDRHGWITVEPHWTLAYPPFTDAIDMDGVWNRCRRGLVVDVETWLLSREDLLINLCWHVHHKGPDAPLLWWHELDLLCRHDDATMDWPAFVGRIGGGLPARFIAEVLTTLVRQFGSPVPDSVLTDLRRSACRVTPRFGRLYTGPLAVDGVESLATFLALRGVRAKARYARSVFIPSREFMAHQYGLSTLGRLGLGYAVRGFSLAWTAMKGLLNFLLPVRLLPHR